MAVKRKLKKEKRVLVFDENSRREYLLGFRKRKNERRKKAREDLTKKEKERRKELKQEKKRSMVEQMEKHKKELEALESDDEKDEQEVAPPVDATFDYPEHVVTVTTIGDVNLDSGKFACIGPNKGLMEKVKSQTDTSLSETQNHSLLKATEKGISRQKSHKKFRRKRSSKKSLQQQDSQPGKSKKRKQLHSRGKSKHFKKS